MASYLKRTDYLQRLKTRELIYQDVSGAYPVQGAVGYFVDASGTFGTSTVTIDSSGNMAASTLTVGTGDGVGSAPAIVANGDIRVNSANLYVSGNQNETGSVSAEYLTLLDYPNGNSETYLWADNSQLLWQVESQPPLNISQAVANQNVGTTIALANAGTIVTQFNALLTYFANKGLFLNTAAPVVPTIYFNSNTNIRFTVKTDNTVVNTFTNTGSTQLLDALCTTLNNDLDNGNVIYEPEQLTVTIQPSTDYTITVSDVLFAGEARRFLNHLGLMTIPLPGVPFTLPIIGSSFLSITANNDAPLAAPGVAISNITKSSALLTITPPSTALLTPPNVLQYYGIYLNGTDLSNNIALMSATSTTFTVIVTPSTTPVLQTVNVYAIDDYNQSAVATTTFTPIAEIVWPPTGFLQGYFRNSTATYGTNNFLIDLIPFARRVSASTTTFSFTLFPYVDLINICLRLNVCDSATVTFADTLTTTYSGAPPPPSPLVRIPGPQPSSEIGGSIQFSQPISLLASKVGGYEVNIVFATVAPNRAFSLSYVIPTAPGGAAAWYPGAWNYTNLNMQNKLMAQNLSQFSFIPG